MHNIHVNKCVLKITICNEIINLAEQNFLFKFIIKTRQASPALINYLI